MAVRPVKCVLDEMGNFQVFNTVPLNETGSVKDSSQPFALPANLSNFMSVAVWGTFDGATFRLQSSHDGGTTWLDLTSAITAATVLGSSARGPLMRGIITVDGIGDASQINFSVYVAR